MVIPGAQDRAVASDSENTTSRCSDEEQDDIVPSSDTEDKSDDVDVEGAAAGAADDDEEHDEPSAAGNFSEPDDLPHFQMMSAEEFSKKGSYDNAKCLKVGLINISASFDKKRDVSELWGKFTFHGVAPLNPDVPKYPLRVRLHIKHGLLVSKLGQTDSISIASLLTELQRFKLDATGAMNSSLSKKASSAFSALTRLQDGSWRKKKWLFKRTIEMMFAQRWSDKMPTWQRRFTREFLDALHDGSDGGRRNVFLHVMNTLLPRSYQRILELEDELATARGGDRPDVQEVADASHGHMNVT